MITVVLISTLLPILMIGIIFILVYFFILAKCKYLKLKIKEVKSFDFETEKINKVKKIVEYDNSFASDLKEWSKIKKIKKKICSSDYKNINQAIKLIKTFKLIKGIKKYYQINKEFNDFYEKFWKAVDSINSLFVHEDFIRIFLYDLQNIFSQIKNEYEKNSENLRICSSKLKKNIRKIDDLFFEGLSNIDNGKYIGLKKILIEISQRLENLCKLIPTLIIGIKVYEKWFDEAFNDALTKSKNYLEKNLYNAQIRNLNFYKPKILAAINDLNFREIEILITNFYSLVGEMYEKIEWNNNAKKLYDSYLEKLKHYYGKISDDYSYIVYMYNVEKNKSLINLNIKLDIEQLSEKFNNIMMIYNSLINFKTNNKNINSNHLSSGGDFYLNKMKKFEVLLVKITEFSSLSEKVYKKITEFLFLKATIKQRVYNLKKYFIKIVSLQTILGKSKFLNHLNSLNKWKIVLNDAAQLYNKYDLKELKLLNLQINKIDKQIIDEYNYLTSKYTDIKKIELNLLSWNSRFKDFYLNNEEKSKISKAIVLFNNKNYLSAKKELLNLSNENKA